MDGEEIEELRKLTGLVKRDEREMGFIPVRTFYSVCESCMLFGKGSPCPLRERNPRNVACVYYQEKKQS